MGTGTSDLTPQKSREEEVIRAVLSGRREMFRELVEEHQGKVFALVMRQVGDKQVAEELTQEAFLKAFVHLNKFQFRSQFSTWLVRIALNTTHSYFSSRRFKEQQQSDSFNVDLHEPSLRAESQDSVDHEDVTRLRTIVAELPSKYREVMVLCAFEERSYEEVAAILAIPLGTVRSRLNKARHLIREKFYTG